MATLVGTSGFSYEDWRGALYPADLPKADFLRYYSLFFPFVELDFSYYRMPEAPRLASMADSVPRDFLFAIKAHRSLTHEVDSGWESAAEAFRAAVAAPSFRGRLAAVLLQFPYRFRYSPDNRRYLALLTKALSSLPLFLEFRNAEWERPSVVAEVAKRGLGLVAVDAPELPNLPGRSLPLTADSGYLRFHGRNAAAWWTGDNVSRYDYSYPDGELAEWKPKVLEASGKARLFLVAFNNHHKGNAVRDARRFTEMLAAPPLVEARPSAEAPSDERISP